MSVILTTAGRFEIAREVAHDLARAWWGLPFRLRARRFPKILETAIHTARVTWAYGDKRADLAIDSPISPREITSAAESIGAPRAMVRMMRTLIGAGTNVRRTVRAQTVMVGARSDLDGRATFVESAPESANEAKVRARDSRVTDLALRCELSADLADTLRKIDLPTLRHLARTLVARNPVLAAEVRGFIRDMHTGAMARLSNVLDDLADAVRAKSARPDSAACIMLPNVERRAIHTRDREFCDDGGGFTRPVCARSPVKSRRRAKA